MNDLVKRAIAAYLRSGGADMPSNASGCRKVGRKQYVRLANVNGVLAVFRVRNDGMLKRMKRYPSELEAA